MVEVFRTNIKDPKSAQTVVDALSTKYPFAIINIDLEDCDKILRFEADQIDPQLPHHVTDLGFTCEVLED
ncbi:hypothetical protein GYB22_07145 [bacterium]|jgi:hypothetical protein|nr:hypothetical protein [bacterium]